MNVSQVPIASSMKRSVSESTAEQSPERKNKQRRSRDSFDEGAICTDLAKHYLHVGVTFEETLQYIIDNPNERNTTAYKKSLGYCDDEILGCVTAIWAAAETRKRVEKIIDVMSGTDNVTKVLKRQKNNSMKRVDRQQLINIYEL